MPVSQPSGESKQQVEDLLASPELARVVESDEFKQFLDHIPVAILVSRVRGEHARIVYCNRAFTDMSGEDCAAVEGKNWSILDSFHEEEKPDQKLGAAVFAGDDFIGMFRKQADGSKTVLVEAYAGTI